VVEQAAEHGHQRQIFPQGAFIDPQISQRLLALAMVSWRSFCQSFRRRFERMLEKKQVRDTISISRVGLDFSGMLLSNFC
jgi:hypothetical protein